MAKLFPVQIKGQPNGFILVGAGATAPTYVQPKDEGVALGEAATVEALDFVGAGVTATRVDNTILVTIPGGGGGGITNIMPITPVAGTAFTATGVHHTHLLRTDNAAATTITVGLNPGAAWSTDLADGPYFSIIQRGTGTVNVVGEAGVTIQIPEGFLPQTRDQGSAITLTGDGIATNSWTISGDLELTGSFTGPAGPTGPTGATGATGATGPTGPAGSYTVVSKSATYTETTTSNTLVIECDATAGSFTINLPTAVGNTAQFLIKKIDASANTVTIDPNGAQTVDGAATAVLTVQYEAIVLYSNNTNWGIY